jgi:hypothetical protein
VLDHPESMVSLESFDTASDIPTLEEQLEHKAVDLKKTQFLPAAEVCESCNNILTSYCIILGFIHKFLICLYFLLADKLVKVVSLVLFGSHTERSKDAGT